MQNLFDEIKIPQKELDNIVNEKLSIIQTQSRKKKKYHILYGFSAAAACVAVLIIFSVSNPVLAAQIPLIGHLFGKVEEKQSYYRNIETKPVQVIPETKEEENNVDGMKISLSEIYCNTEAMYMTVLIESEEAFPDYLLQDYYYTEVLQDEDYVSSIMLNGEQHFDFIDEPFLADTQVMGEYLDNHTFAGTARIDFLVGYGGGNIDGDTLDFQFPDTIPESFHWSMKVDKIYNYYDTADSYENGYNELYTKEGPWSFEADVSAKQTEKIVKDVYDYGPNGMGITTAEKGEFEIILNLDYDESRAEYEVEAIESVVLDADGKYMLDKAGMLPIGDFNVSKIDVYYFPIGSEEEWIAIQKKLTVGEPADFIKETAIHHTEISFE